MTHQQVEMLADEVTQAALKLAHLEITADLTNLARESMMRMRPIYLSGTNTPEQKKVEDDRIASMKRALSEICEQLDIESAVAKKAYNESVEKFKSFAASLTDTNKED
jgi:hypothetical protein